MGPCMSLTTTSSLFLVLLHPLPKGGQENLLVLQVSQLKVFGMAPMLMPAAWSDFWTRSRLA